MAGLKQITDWLTRFLGIVKLTPEQKKRIDQMAKDYEQTFGQKSAQRPAAPNEELQGPQVLRISIDRSTDRRQARAVAGSRYSDDIRMNLR
jgi:hypothetical protein